LLGSDRLGGELESMRGEGTEGVMEEPRKEEDDDPLLLRFKPPNMPPVVGRSWMSGVSRIVARDEGMAPGWRELPPHDPVDGPGPGNEPERENPLFEESRRSPPFIQEGDEADGLENVVRDARWDSCERSLELIHEEEPELLTLRAQW
jgi:hypothetical protein